MGELTLLCPAVTLFAQLNITGKTPFIPTAHDFRSASCDVEDVSRALREVQYEKSKPILLLEGNVITRALPTTAISWSNMKE